MNWVVTNSYSMDPKYIIYIWREKERERERAQLVLVDNVLREIGTGSGEEARKRDK